MVFNVPVFWTLKIFTQNSNTLISRFKKFDTRTENLNNLVCIFTLFMLCLSCVDYQCFIYQSVVNSIADTVSRIIILISLSQLKCSILLRKFMYVCSYNGIKDLFGTRD